MAHPLTATSHISLSGYGTRALARSTRASGVSPSRRGRTARSKARRLARNWSIRTMIGLMGHGPHAGIWRDTVLLERRSLRPQ